MGTPRTPLGHPQAKQSLVSVQSQSFADYLLYIYVVGFLSAVPPFANQVRSKALDQMTHCIHLTQMPHSGSILSNVLSAQTSYFFSQCASPSVSLDPASVTQPKESHWVTYLTLLTHSLTISRLF
jgi:hypothetical protein